MASLVNQEDATNKVETTAVAVGNGETNCGDDVPRVASVGTTGVRSTRSSELMSSRSWGGVGDRGACVSFLCCAPGLFQAGPPMSSHTKTRRNKEQLSARCVENRNSPAEAQSGEHLTSVLP